MYIIHKIKHVGMWKEKKKLSYIHSNTSKFNVQVCSGNVHARDCGPAHCNGCVVNGISARTAC